mmetsp:Transcript_6252/g.15528  ORF Transcript_6252/g.15528 Transcript_6252/m.15528 type:complete len:626 (+) Transcript_6252:42-1919(+)
MARPLASMSATWSSDVGRRTSGQFSSEGSDGEIDEFARQQLAKVRQTVDASSEQLIFDLSQHVQALCVRLRHHEPAKMNGKDTAVGRRQPSVLADEPDQRLPHLRPVRLKEWLTLPAVEGPAPAQLPNDEVPKHEPPITDFMDLRQKFQHIMDDEDQEDADTPMQSSPTPHLFDFKQRIEAIIAEEEFDIRRYLHPTGLVRTLVLSSTFEAIALGVIFLNSIWISVEADLSSKRSKVDATSEALIVEHCFCAFFTLEWLIRFFAFKRKVDARMSYWFLFDSALWAMMILETWILPVISFILTGDTGGHLIDLSFSRLVRIARFTRTARIVRLLRLFPELMMLIKAILVAARSVIFTMGLLGMIIYVFAVLFRQLSADTAVGDEYFPSMLATLSMLLLELGPFPDQSRIVRLIFSSDPMLGTLLFIFLIVTLLTVMQLLIGILVQVVGVIAAAERDSMETTLVRDRLRAMYKDIGDESTITSGDFTKLLQERGTAKQLQDIGVDVLGLWDLMSYIFEDGKPISFSKLLELLLSLRGGKPATVKDVVDLRLRLMRELSRRSTIRTTPSLLKQPPGDVVPTGRLSMRLADQQTTDQHVMGRRGSEHARASLSLDLQGDGDVQTCRLSL